MEDKRKKQKRMYMLPFTGRRKSNRVKTVVELSVVMLAIALAFVLAFAGCKGTASPPRDAVWIRLAPTALAEKDGVRTATLLLDFSEPIEGLDDERTPEDLNSFFTFGMAGASSGASSSAERPVAGIQATKIVRSASGMYFLTVKKVPESGIVVVDINKDGITPKSRLWNVGGIDVPSVVAGVDLAPGITAPAPGTAPTPAGPGAATGGTTASFETPADTGVITWSKAPPNPVYPGVFSRLGQFYTDATYTATVTLTAKGGYTFTGLEADAFRYSTYGHVDPADPAAGWIRNDAGSGDGNTLTVTIVFPKTGSLTVEYE
jgi:hypothetical protein